MKLRKSPVSGDWLYRSITLFFRRSSEMHDMSWLCLQRDLKEQTTHLIRFISESAISLIVG